MDRNEEKIKEFMRLAKQDVPDRVTEIDEETRLLRAKLIFEECMETIEALGVDVYIPLDECEYNFSICGELDLVGVADGCADIQVVTIGTLAACGIPNEKLMDMVNDNNLAKFGEGHSFREDGKLIKPAGHKPPDIAGYLEELGYEHG